MHAVDGNRTVPGSFEDARRLMSGSPIAKKLRVYMLLEYRALESCMVDHKIFVVPDARLSTASPSKPVARSFRKGSARRHGRGAAIFNAAITREGGRGWDEPFVRADIGLTSMACIERGHADLISRNRGSRSAGGAEENI